MNNEMQSNRIEVLAAEILEAELCCSRDEVDKACVWLLVSAITNLLALFDRW